LSLVNIAELVSMAYRETGSERGPVSHTDGKKEHPGIYAWVPVAAVAIQRFACWVDSQA
jgi:hypothetical protein